MKIFPILLLSMALMPAVRADEKSAAETSSFLALPEKPTEPTKPAFSEPLPLIPDAPPMTDRPGSLEERKRELKKAPRSGPPGTVQEHIQLRELKTRALTDGTLQAQWDLAQRAQTNNGKRAAIKKYYVMFYDRMGRLDPKWKGKMDEKKAYLLQHFDTARLKPSELIEGEMPFEVESVRVND